MEKHLQEIKIYTTMYANQPLIAIEQPIPHQDDQIICINPEQAEIVIQWIREAVSEITQDKS